MKEYLKMADYFVEGGISSGDIRIVDGGKHTIIYSCEEAASHAINSHDELVVEVERLRGSLLQCAEALYIAHKFCGNHTADECGDEIAIPISDALVVASKLVAP